MTTHKTLKELEELRKQKNPIILKNLYYNIYKNKEQTNTNYREWKQNISEVDTIINNSSTDFVESINLLPLFNEDLSLENTFVKITIETLPINKTLTSKNETYSIVYNFKNKTIGTIEFGVSFEQDSFSNITENVQSRRFPVITTTGIFNPYKLGTVEVFYNNNDVSTRTITFLKQNK